MPGGRPRIAIVLLLVLGASSMLAPLEGPLRIASAFLRLFYFPGLFFLLAAGDSRRPALDTVFIPLLLSPVLSAVPIMMVAAAGVPLHAGAAAVGAGYMILTLGASLLRRERRDEPKSSVTPLVLVVSGGFALLVAVSYLLNRFLIIRSDAWFHGCVLSDILARGLPPMEPGFPDVPIRYMWTYHVFNAAWKNHSGLPVFPALAAFNVVNALTFPYVMARLASIFFSGRRSVMAAVLVAVTGLESAAWILWPLSLARAFAGEVSGLAEVTRVIGGIEIGNAGVIEFLKLHWTWMVSLPDKFLTITAFSYTLNLFVYAFMCACDERLLGRSKLSYLLHLFTAMMGALLFHVIVGMALIISALGAVLLSAAVRIARGSRLLPRSQALALAAAALLALGAAVPYLRSLLYGGSGGAGPAGYLQFGIRNVITIAAPLLVLFPAAKRAVRSILRPEGPQARMLLLWIAPLAALNAVTNLPTVNESKLVFPFFLLVIPHLGRELVAWYDRGTARRRRALVVWLVFLFAIPFALTFRGFLLDKPRDYCERKRFEISPAERDIYGWIERHTPPRASIIMRSRCNLIPVLAGRRGFVPSGQTINVDGYAGPKVDLYLRLHEDLFSDAPGLDADLAALAGTGIDYYLVLWSEDRVADPALEGRFDSHPRSFDKVFENEAGIVYEIRTRER